MIRRNRINDDPVLELDFSDDVPMAYYDVTCDFCSGGCDEYDAASWNDLQVQLKEAGWKTSKGDSNEMVHAFPDCNGN